MVFQINTRQSQKIVIRIALKLPLIIVFTTKNAELLYQGKQQKCFKLLLRTLNQPYFKQKWLESAPTHASCDAL